MLFVIIKSHDLRSAVVFLTPGTRDVVIQISCPLVQLQIVFASLLQEAEMVPFFVDLCNSCCVIQIQEHIQSGFIFAESFQAEKDSL